MSSLFAFKPFSRAFYLFISISFFGVSAFCNSCISLLQPESEASAPAVVITGSGPLSQSSLERLKNLFQFPIVASGNPSNILWTPRVTRLESQIAETANGVTKTSSQRQNITHNTEIRVVSYDRHALPLELQFANNSTQPFVGLHFYSSSGFGVHFELNSFFKINGVHSEHSLALENTMKSLLTTFGKIENLPPKARYAYGELKKIADATFQIEESSIGDKFIVRISSADGTTQQFTFEFDGQRKVSKLEVIKKEPLPVGPFESIEKREGITTITYIF